MAITGVDAKDVANGEIGIGLLDDPDFVVGADITLVDDTQVGAGAHGFGEAARKQLVIHANSKPPAGNTRLGNLENGSSDLPSLSDKGVVHGDSFRREVLSELAVRERPADLLLPPLSVFDGICVDRLVGTPVCAPICLIVSGQIDASGRDPAARRHLPDGASREVPAVFELARSPDADRENPSRSDHHSLIHVKRHLWHSFGAPSASLSVLHRGVMEKVEIGLVDYALFRPHQDIGGATPAEVYFGRTRAHLSAIPPPRGRPGEGPMDSPFRIEYLDAERLLPVLVQKAA